jgi:hypothetical protein
MIMTLCNRWLLALVIYAGITANFSPAQLLQIQQNFNSDPLAGEWRTFGDGSLFQWSAANQNLEVTWDSSRSNSYYYIPLGITLTREHNFRFSADLTLKDITAGVNPDKAFAFEIAFGLLNWTDATNANCLRGTGSDSPNLVEFTFFPDTGYGATISPVIITASNEWAPAWIIQDLPANDLFHIEMNYSSGNHSVYCSVSRNGQPYASGVTGPYPATFSDFRVDTLSINSYSDAGGWGSILAHGTIDNVGVTVDPPRVSGVLSNNTWSTRFVSLTNYVYTLETTSDLHAWSPRSSTPGTGAIVSLAHTNSEPYQFYRVIMEKR